MPTAYPNRPMSEILAPEGTPAQAPTAPAAAAPTTSTLPEKYQGKTVEQVAEMHQNAERRLGSIQNELGTMRGLVTDLSSLQRSAAAPEPAVQEIDVSGDDLLSDPVAAVRKIVQPELDRQESNRALDAAEQNLFAENQALLNDYDVDSIVSTPEFQTFATRTPTRARDFQTAANGEGVDQVRAARRLLEDFQDFTATSVVTVPDAKLTPVQQAKAVQTEAGHTSAPLVGAEPLHEADVIALLNSDPDKYRSPSYQAELLSAIREGRYIRST
jgi:hypothetical protein